MTCDRIKFLTSHHFGRQTDRQTDRQTEKKDRQTDRQVLKILKLKNTKTY